MSDSPGPRTGRWIVIYDEDCGFCRWSADRLLRWDRGGHLEAVALGDARTDVLLAGMPEEIRISSWHLVGPDGRARSAGAAAGPLLRLLPGARPLAVIAETFPRTTERLYRWVARNRGTFGRLLGEGRCAVRPGGDPPPSG